MMTNTKSPVTHSIYRAELQKKILFSQKQIRENIEATDAKIIHRTQAKNHKSPHETFADEQAAREHIMSEQIKAWRSMLPVLIKKFSRIPIRDELKVLSIRLSY